MKRFLSLFTLALFLGLFTVMPAFAQDTDAIATSAFNASTILNYIVVIALAVLLVAALIFGGRIIPYLANLVPAETASSIYASGVRFGFQIALNRAAQTPSPLDDEFFEEMARTRGLQVIKRPDGSYDVIQPPIVKAQSSNSVDPTSGLPNLPSSGAATTYPSSPKP